MGSSCIPRRSPRSARRSSFRARGSKASSRPRRVPATTSECLSLEVTSGTACWVPGAWRSTTSLALQSGSLETTPPWSSEALRRVEQQRPLFVAVLLVGLGPLVIGPPSLLGLELYSSPLQAELVRRQLF